MVTVCKEKQAFTYLRKLPLLNFTCSLYPNLNLNDIYIICAQHLVSTTYSLFHTLLQLGLNPSNLSAIGKCYSTDPTAVIEMQKLGLDICSTSLNFDSHLSFDQQYYQNIKKFVRKRIKKIENSKFKKIIVLDDGGELLSEINSKLQNSLKIIGIEQTSSGYEKIKKQNLNFPVINLARSAAKLNHESPIIAKLVCNCLTESLKNLSLKPGNALIIGNGSIGSHISTLLKKTHEVHVFDKNSTKSDIQLEDLKNSLKIFDLIIGCTGAPVLSIPEINLLKKDVLLVSASSSDREFNANELRKKIPPVSDCHKHLFINNKWLINCGFPINFSSQFRTIDCDELQLTRSLLLASILQAVSNVDNSKTGFIPLNINNQEDILKNYYTLYQKETPKDINNTFYLNRSNYEYHLL